VGNVATNLAAIGYFSWQASPLWGIALVMAAANLFGSFAGTWFALQDLPAKAPELIPGMKPIACSVCTWYT